MYPLNQLKTLVSCGRDPARSLPFRRGFLLIPLILVSFALAHKCKRRKHTRSRPLPVTNTGDGSNVLAGITAGATFNSAFGFDALLGQPCGRFQHRYWRWGAPAQHRGCKYGRWRWSAFKQHLRCEQHGMRRIRGCSLTRQARSIMPSALIRSFSTPLETATTPLVRAR